MTWQNSASSSFIYFTNYKEKQYVRKWPSRAQDPLPAFTLQIIKKNNKKMTRQSYRILWFLYIILMISYTNRMLSHKNLRISYENLIDLHKTPKDLRCHCRGYARGYAGAQLATHRRDTPAEPFEATPGLRQGVRQGQAKSRKQAPPKIGEIPSPCFSQGGVRRELRRIYIYIYIYIYMRNRQFPLGGVRQGVRRIYIYIYIYVNILLF
jgi:hypothetical protein